MSDDEHRFGDITCRCAICEDDCIEEDHEYDDWLEARLAAEDRALYTVAFGEAPK